MAQPFRFLHISDTHLGPTKDFKYYDKNAYRETERLVAMIENLPVDPEFIIHTGDVVSFQGEAAYGLANEILGKLKAPLYFATGNHDDPELLKNLLPSAHRTPLVDGDNVVSYYFEAGENLFVTLDCKHPDNNNPSGVLPLNQLEALEKLLSSTDRNFVIFTHFPPLSIDAPWMDENLLISNGKELHKCLMKFASRSLGVFFGHIHQPLEIYADGIRYVSAPSTTFQFGGWPTDSAKPSHNPCGVAGINLVTIWVLGSS